MNLKNLHLLIERYEQGLDTTMNQVHREQMKWAATKHFRDDGKMMITLEETGYGTIQR